VLYGDSFLGRSAWPQPFRDQVLLRYYYYSETAGLSRTQRTRSHLLQRSGLGEQVLHTFDIFEGTEQIQHLVISRATSGLRIE
jgi:hypothetical protein